MWMYVRVERKRKIERGRMKYIRRTMFFHRCQVRYDLYEINDGRGVAPVQRTHRLQIIGD